VSEPHRINAGLDRVGQLVARNAALREIDAARVADGSPIEADDLAAARAEGLGAARAALWRRIIPQRYHTASLADWSGEVGDDLAEWAANPDGRNLLLLGPVGTGKTHAAVAACRPAHDRGLDVAYWPTGKLLDVLRPTDGPDRIEIDDVVDVDRLILDDVGVERPTDWTAERLDLIIDGRWAEVRPTVLTTNLRLDALRERLGARGYDRLTGSAIALQLSGDTRRRTAR